MDRAVKKREDDQPVRRELLLMGLIFSFSRNADCRHVHAHTQMSLASSGKTGIFTACWSLDLLTDLTHVSLTSGLPSEILPFDRSLWKFPNCHSKNFPSLPSSAGPQP